MNRALFFQDPLFATLIQIYFFLIGAIIGSFLNVCIHRIPLKKSIVTPRSACPHCGTMIPWYHNIPIFSYLWLRGKCFHCKGPISVTYPLVELMTAVIFVLLYRHFGISLALLIYAFFSCSTIVLIFIDYYHRLLPAKITFPTL